MLVSAALSEHAAAIGYVTSGPLRAQASNFPLLPNKPWSVSALRTRPRARMPAAAGSDADAKRRHPISPPLPPSQRTFLPPAAPNAQHFPSGAPASESPTSGSAPADACPFLDALECVSSPQKRARVSDESDSHENYPQATAPRARDVTHMPTPIVWTPVNTNSFGGRAPTTGAGVGNGLELDQSVRIISPVPPPSEFGDSFSTEAAGNTANTCSGPGTAHDTVWTGEQSDVRAPHNMQFQELKRPHSPLHSHLAPLLLSGSGADFATPSVVLTSAGPHTRRSMGLRPRIVTNPFYRRKSASRVAESELCPPPGSGLKRSCASLLSPGAPEPNGAHAATTAPVNTSAASSCLTSAADTLPAQIDQTLADPAAGAEPLGRYCSTPRDILSAERLDKSQQAGHTERLEIALEMCSDGASTPPPRQRTFASSVSMLSPSPFAFGGSGDRRPSLESTPMAQRRRSSSPAPAPGSGPSRNAGGTTLGHVDNTLLLKPVSVRQPEPEMEPEPQPVRVPEPDRRSVGAERSFTSNSERGGTFERIKRTARRSLQSLLRRSRSFRAASSQECTPNASAYALDDDVDAGASASVSASRQSSSAQLQSQPPPAEGQHSTRAEKYRRRHSGLPDEDRCTLTALTRCSSPEAAVAPPHVQLLTTQQSQQQAVIVPITSKKRRLVDLVFRK